MDLLTRIKGPRDLDRLSVDELEQLAEEIRTFLVDAVSKTGGHLGPNLGVVELTIALHRVFESPRDKVLWDTGHQSYVHKLLTGRQDFSRLKSKGGLSGYPSRAESEHDIIENSHASTVLGWADGLAKANEVLKKDDHVVAVIGDGALTGGMAWEALNNIAAAKDRPLVIVVNDNERSYAPTIGGLANHLATLRTTDGYERFLARGKDILERTPVVGRPLYETLHGAKKGLKDFIAPQGMFEDLGLKYVGPIDGHDIEALESALQRAKRFGGPVIVHCLTEKGRGYTPALQDEADRFHAVGKIHPDTGLPISTSGLDWTSVFGDEMLKLGQEREDIVAITAAMLQPVGLGKFEDAFPDRIYDVGIAEQHGAVSAAGLATGGLHPVFAVYATFLNRAFDQVLMDVALHKCGVTFVLDRAGVTGTDGASHNGMWDMSIVQCRADPQDLRPARRRPGPCPAPRGRRRRRRAHRGPVLQGRRRPGRPGRRQQARRHGRPAPSRRRPARTSWSSPSARSPRCAWRSPTCWTPRASPAPSSTRAGSNRWTRRSPRSPSATASSSRSRTTAAPAASAPPSPRPCVTPGSTYRCATSASRRSSSTTPPAARSWPRSG
ncbi:1-deoxy-D-xylulose-5-phosphate synthase [Streptomyces microflavus]